MTSSDAGDGYNDTPPSATSDEIIKRLVVDELAVTPSGSVGDREIADRLTKGLERRLVDDVALVQVTVEDGVLTLKAAVSNAAAYRVAQELAEHTQGVVAIHNELKFPRSK